MKNIMFIFFLVVILTGCWDKKEIEERAFIAAIGIDNGNKENLSVTLLIANPQVGTSDIARAENEPASEIITFETPDIASVKELANVTVTREITYSHVRVIIIGEEFAKSDEFLPLSDYLMRDRELRREADLIVSKEKAADFIRGNDAKLETRAHKHYELMATRWQETGLSPFATFDHYIERIITDESLFLAVYGTTETLDSKLAGKEDNYTAGQVDKYGGNPLQMIGSAVIKEGKMIGTLTGEETRLSLILRPKIKMDSYIVNYPDPLKRGHDVTVRLIKHRENKYKMDLFKETPELKVTIPIDVEIIGIPSGIDYVTDLEKQELFKESVKEKMHKKAMALVKKTQDEFEGEPFLWGSIARKEFATTKEFDQFDWMKMYPYINIQIDYEVTFVDSGRLLKPYDLDKIRD